ncbi:MAG: hypothetical protein IJQ29_08170 [Synergistaceae bacterium]|nr:hypothetical protein [Synergistaceae bacterium]
MLSKNFLKFLGYFLVLNILILNMAGCGGGSSGSNSNPATEDEQEYDHEDNQDNQDETPVQDQPMEQTEYISQIPSSYLRQAANRGQIITENYRSRDYTLSSSGNSSEIIKTAYVYLPYNYDESKQYNILYLMHGWTMTAGDFFNDSSVINILDNLIANGSIEPLIVVCATFDADNKSQSFSRSVEELSVFHNDFRDDLVPYIESKYSTYAGKNVSAESLRSSREHRAFGGFSLGAVTTWYQFIYNLDCVKYFLPMSGDCWIIATYGGRDYPAETTRYLEKVVSDGRWNEEDFYIYQGIGTADPIWEQTNNQIQEMIKTSTFTARNLHYAIIQDGRHDLTACEMYIYHGLQKFFGSSSHSPSYQTVNESTKIKDVINNSLFGDYGRLIFPVNQNYYSGETLGSLSLTWYSNIKASRTVEIINYMLSQVQKGSKIFYKIYPEDDPRSNDTGLFFFKGNKNAKFAVCNAGGGFVFVGAMHDSFPHALELSKKGYNAFALIYRPGAETACEDLARAIAFIHDNAKELEVDVKNYSLWGGSAGARMAAWLGTYGTEAFGEKNYPRPAAVIMQYTGLSEVTGNEPPTYNCVGTNDGIASYLTMQNRINRIKANGTDAEIEIFNGLSHGFGLGEGTVAEGWLDRAVKFWERQN